MTNWKGVQPPRPSGYRMRRRELMLLFSGAALLCSPIGRAQEPGSVYRLGIMAGLLREDSGYVAL